MDPRLGFHFLFGAIGGTAAYFVGLPMPFLLGGIVGTASFVLAYERDGRELPKLSRWVRLCFAAVIGAMIGSRFLPEHVPLLLKFWVSGPAIIAFILVALGGNYAIMRGLGGYAKKDAFFAGLPGGIIDSVILAEKAGADVRVVTAQHFIRIILVVGSVPLLFWAVEGDVVGSVAGETLAQGQYDVSDVASIVLIAAAGLFLGRLLRLPVAHLMGPLLLALALSLAGVIRIDIPVWLQHVAQFMLGVSLGAQFSGLSRKMLLRGLWIGLLSGAFMLGLAAVIAILLGYVTPAGFGALFISFAAGGLAEMSLIALSLDFNPVVVALHHLARIFLTIWIGSFLWRWLASREGKS
ncbi:MAG: AbrB family transcriptional regulator [Litoreibacter sp.]|nr:AbrB family transcriptional regulator [Litoreibacter sp.]